MTTPARPRRTAGAILLEFLGSMNLAITLLVAVAFSSVIGTILKQNEPYQNYILEFGPFWFEVYKSLGLYDVYSAAWFLVIMTFLITSTSVCVYRNGPRMLRDMRAYREDTAERSLRAFHNKAEWSFAHTPDVLREVVMRHLLSYGYRLRVKQHDDHTVVAAMKGAANRLGYLGTHIGVVVVCVGALLDGNLPLKFAELTGKVRVETRQLPSTEVPAISRLSADTASFRGLVTIPEGATVNYVGLKLRDGILLQELPFQVKVADFRIEQYDNGQPKSFESDLVIYDGEGQVPQKQTISVNHPWFYKGYAIYIVSFSDGGSKLKLQAWPLAGAAPVQTLQGEVGKSLKLAGASGPRTIEFGDFRLYNVKPAPAGSGKQFQDIGPNFTFKLRDESGVALEYENYMQPQEHEGRWYLVSGVRDNPDAEFTYLRIPVDTAGGIGRFMRFRAALLDAQKVRMAVQKTVQEPMTAGLAPDPRMQQALTALLEKLLAQFNAGGFETVTEFVQQSLPQEQRAETARLYVEFLHQTLRELYDGAAAGEGGSITQADHSRFFDDAVNALGVLRDYGSPWFLQLADFQHIEAAVLQVTHAPGKSIVYTGFGLLIMGVFIMFYLPQRRVWALLRQEGGMTRVVFAGSTNRDSLGFAKDFAELHTGLEARLRAL
ncbi:MAG: cytochrome c biogenesis protein ResB [Proteobacteria bacterium]|nr:cytochrome c biogenesis protein ResB [Pseudomonadota bacterium]